MQHYFLVFIFSFFVITPGWSNVPDSFTQNNIKYQTFFGDCPSKSSELMTLTVMKEFEKNHSLKDVKERILREKLDEKYFLSEYRISFNPAIKTVRVNLKCPEPLAKVQVYKTNGDEHYSAILGENAKLYEPQYENLMKAEKKIRFNLPLLAITTDQLEGAAPTILAELMKKMGSEIRSKVSEIILSKNNDLTVIFALGPKATSVFMGSEFWDEKLTKLEKIVSYVSKNKRYPATINLVNSKKVVVKFSDKI
jgi:hypothetical protein